jgi:hypothetical protein
MFEVKVTFEAGETLKALMSGFMQPVVIEKPVVAEKPAAVEKPVAIEKPVAVEKPVTTQKAVVEKPAPKGKPSFEELDDAAKLEAIKAEVTKQTKNKKGADIKFMLAQFDANRASELAPEHYNDFYAAILRYGKGEAVTDIFPEDLN